MKSNVIPEIGDLTNLDPFVKEVLHSWKNITNRSLISFPGECEQDARLFLSELLLAIPFETRIRLVNKLDVSDNEFQGKLDVAWCSNSASKIPVMLLLLGNLDEECIQLARSRMYAQLHVSKQIAVESQWNHSIYGVMTSVKEWIFVRYDGDKWTESDSMFITNGEDHAGLSRVMNNLFKICTEQSNYLRNVPHT
jgi:hypothetical protein